MKSKKSSVLVVDDESEICKMLKTFFEEERYEVSYALTGKDAIKKLKERKFNAVLLDINLPDIEGTELIPVFKGIHPDIEVVMITGHSTKENAIRALNNNASHYIEKPFNLEELLAKVHGLIEQKNKTSFQGILQESAKSMNVEDMVKSDKASTRALPLKIQKAIKYIEKNYANPDLSLKEIACFVSMHPNSFSNLWRKEMGMEMVNFINGIRIEKAKVLLLKSSFYVSQVAHKVGLAPDYFCKIFKAKVGVPPISYRKTNTTL
ncbi:MAG: DNA-binding response regulator [bacterium]|nr:DNA-binding response regulator [bacterium]